MAGKWTKERQVEEESRKMDGRMVGEGARSSSGGRTAEQRGENTCLTKGGDNTPLFLLDTPLERHRHAFVRRREAQKEEHYTHARCLLA
ncbi:hypothetical protein NQZ68_010696 [Dissostichus eleginoides]|nr:hypothetical protein NQZ68_010696 [Dissostichus eleginoides]